MNEQKNKFCYTYSAPTEMERREIESIRKEYMVSEVREDKLERLRKLNARVKNISVSIAVSLGIFGSLLFGFGMSLSLVWENYVIGILVSAVGIIPIVLANPVYNAVLKRCKAKYGEEILRLSEELLNEHR